MPNWSSVLEHVSGGLSWFAVVGLLLAVHQTLPSQSIPDGSSPVSAAGVMTAGVAIRPRVVEVADVVVPDDGGEIVIAAASTQRSRFGEGSEVVPETAWDGTPLRLEHDGTTVPDASAVEKQKAPEKKSEASKDAPPTPPVTSTVPVTETPAPPESWSAEEVATALKECLRLMGPVDAEIEPVEAMRKGPCGAPAPIRLKSVGKAERIVFDPPVEVNCKLAVAFADFAGKSLQPAAKEMLGKPIARVRGASGYQCRNRYGLANAPLSEHALANAMDVPAFQTTDGRTIKVLGTWGPTARDLIAKDKATEAQAQPAAEKDKPGAKGDVVKTAAKTDAVKDAAKPVPTVEMKEGASRKGKEPRVASLDAQSAQKLGAAPAVSPVVELDKISAEGRFLRRVAKDACQTFGTVLGPEANEAHRDHFHFDMKARKRVAYCQ